MRSLGIIIERHYYYIIFLQLKLNKSTGQRCPQNEDHSTCIYNILECTVIFVFRAERPSYSMFYIYSQKNVLNNSFRTYRTSIKIDKCKNKKNGPILKCHSNKNQFSFKRFSLITICIFYKKLSRRVP